MYTADLSDVAAARELRILGDRLRRVDPDRARAYYAAAAARLGVEPAPPTTPSADEATEWLFFVAKWAALHGPRPQSPAALLGILDALGVLRRFGTAVDLPRARSTKLGI